jgi:enoyl-[acyl-carrier protein] reductase/trans-2-enoyl-CoA reductase (NAD+)
MFKKNCSFVTTTENIAEISDLEGYRSFHNLFGFGFNGVDYKAEANEMVS